jgi:hypothetical protein
MRRNGLRSLLAQSFAIVIIVWPIVHIVLSTFFELNSWKLGGWGMYASTEPSDMRLSVFFVGAEEQSISDLGPVLGNTRFAVINGSEVGQLATKAIPEDQLQILGRLSREIRVMRRQGDMAKFLEILGAAVRREFDREPAYTVLLFSELRFNVLGRRSYARTSAYFYCNGNIRKIGSFNSDTVNSDKLLAEIRAARRWIKEPERS